MIVLTTFERDVEIRRVLEAGALGYLLKAMPPAQMIETIRQVHAGKKCISPDIASRRSHHNPTCSRVGSFHKLVE